MNRVILIVLAVGALTAAPQYSIGADRLPDMNTRMSGNGILDDGTESYEFTDLAIRVRGDQCRITMFLDQGERFEMTGTLSRTSPRCIIHSSNWGRTRATA